MSSRGPLCAQAHVRLQDSGTTSIGGFDGTRVSDVSGVKSPRSARMGKRLAESARAFSATARNPSLPRAQLAFGAGWTAEWAFMVAIGVVAFRDGGTTGAPRIDS
jgi:hypothetical protein